MRLLTACLFSFFLFLFILIEANAKILFNSEVPGFKIITPTDGFYVMDDDGSNVTLLTNQPRARSPMWSPDGKSIVYTVRRSIYLMDADGGNMQEITAPPVGINDSHPFFSPDGKYIVFRRHVDAKHNSSLNVLNLKTGKIKELAEVDAVAPNWSPDGKYIVFASSINVNGMGSGIWRINADGSNLRELLPSKLHGHSILSLSRPRWSPDSRKIVYTQMKYHWRRIDANLESLIREEFQYIICDKNGKTLQKLRIPKDFLPGGIDWMDDGKSIVFSALKYPINEPPPKQGQENYPILNIYKYHIDTGTLTQLTDTVQHDQTVDWISDDVLSVSPKGKMQTQWGVIKQLLQRRSQTFGVLSQNMLFFLRN